MTRSFLLFRSIEDMVTFQERFFSWALAVCIIALFLALGSRALWDPDEGRYAEMAREILVLDDWVTPHLDYLPYFEKPMMYMWLEALSFKAFGVSPWSARLVSLVSALGVVSLAGFMGYRSWGAKAGLTAALCLLTSIEFFVLAHSVDINMTLTLFITAAFVFFWIGHAENKPGYFLLFWTAMACATLTKGPIGIILPLGAIGLYILITRQFGLIRQSRPVIGMTLYLVLTLPWFIMVSMKNPDFFRYFFIDQNIQRYTSSTERYQPFYYFIPVMLGGFLPWTFLVPSAIRRLWGNRSSRDILYLAIWFGFIFAFFTPSHSKLATYVLPCFPAMAMLMGRAFREDTPEGSLPLYLSGTLWGCIGLAMVMVPPLAAHGFALGRSSGMSPVLSSGTLMGLLLFAGILAGLWSGRRYGSLTGVAVTGMAVMITALVFAPRWDDNRSTRSLSEVIPPQARLCSYRTYYPSMSFYAKRQISLIDYRGELEFGVRNNHTEGYVLDLNELAEQMKNDPLVYCVTDAHYLKDIRKMVPNTILACREGNHCLLHVPR